MKMIRVVMIFALPAIVLLAGCVTVKQNDLSAYYSMVHQIGRDAVQPLAEENLGDGDRVLIIHTGPGFSGVGGRYYVDVKKAETIEDEKPYAYNTYMQDYPYFIEYIENGFINSIMDSGGIGFERIEFPGYMRDYVGELLAEDYIFNTSLLEYDWWIDLKEKYDADKILLYSVHNIVQKGVEYMGIQLGMTFIDVNAGGQILYDGVENVVSGGFPESKRVMLRRFFLDIPGDSVTAFEQDLQAVIEEENLLEEEGIPAAFGDEEEETFTLRQSGIDVVLVKVDDIPFLGSYPITSEDFIIEKELASKLGALDNLNVMEKLYKRRYKTNFQLVNAVNYINPFRGGEYSEFQNYYGTRYMLAYKVLFGEQTGKYEDTRDELIDLQEKILGIYVKLIDMSDQGRILLTHFIPVASDQVLNNNFLYKSFTKVNDLPYITAAIEENFAISREEEHSTIINKRMEVFRNYLIRNFPAYGAMIDKLNTDKNSDLLKEYDTIYKLFDEEEREKVKGEIYYIMAAHIMNGWFEEGITDYLVSGGYIIHEKLESIYSRYLLDYRFNGSVVDDDIFLSPMKLRRWGTDIKNFYNLDKVIYFIALEKNVPEAGFITPENVTSETAAAELSQFYPILSHQLEWLLFSVLDVGNGDYGLNRNFNLERGGE